MHLSNSTKGYCFGLIAGMSFGLIPLFSIPVIADGMDNVSILIYRFLFGCIGMLSALLVQKSPLKITLGEFFRISLLSLFYIGTAITTLNAYDYLSSGIATALVYTDPIWCALIGLLFLREKLSWKTTSALVITIAGVLLLTNALTEPAKFSAIGVSWGLLSGLTYALYIIFLPRLNLKGIPSLKLTFYVFFLSMIYLSIYQLAVAGGIDSIPSKGSCINLVLLGLIPTALSNICVTLSLRLIKSTVVALLGALEPVTAMIVGICILGDPVNGLNILGGALVLLAVLILTVKTS